MGFFQPKGDGIEIEMAERLLLHFNRELMAKGLATKLQNPFNLIYIDENERINQIWYDSEQKEIREQEVSENEW